MTEYDVIVIGGGPAGSSAAISLAGAGLGVLLVEQKRMPRTKLCGEFLAPEAFPSLHRLGVLGTLLDHQAHQISRLILNVPGTDPIKLPLCDFSKDPGWALSMSRRAFDQVLFERARQLGSSCLEGFAVRDCIPVGGRGWIVRGISVPEGNRAAFRGRFIIDASGRNSRLTRTRQCRTVSESGRRLYAMQVHLAGIPGIDDQVELFFFRGGYGGLSRIEGGLVNLCFVTETATIRNGRRDVLSVAERSIFQNQTAADLLANATVVGVSQTTGPLVFGTRPPALENVISIGDAAGMIDPFTGTGIQKALRTGEMAADSILEGLRDERLDAAKRVAECYRRRYRKEFGTRIRIAGALRSVALSTPTAIIATKAFSFFPFLGRAVLWATR